MHPTSVGGVGGVGGAAFRGISSFGKRFDTYLPSRKVVVFHVGFEQQLPPVFLQKMQRQGLVLATIKITCIVP